MNYSKYFFFVLLFTVFSCSEKRQKPEEKKGIHTIEKKTMNKDVALLTYKITKSETTGYGYAIMMDNRLFIDQPTIPGQPGNKGFQTKEKAVKVAKLVIYKIKNNQFPPSIAREELDSLNVL